MYIIGLTGNIATGKSTVTHILEQFGARVIDADQVAHAVYRRGSPAWRAVVDAFGLTVLYPDGHLDRRKLGSVVFNDAVKLKTLEQISHPAVGTELALLVRDALKQPGAEDRVLVVEAVKLYEAGMHEFMDALWVVTAPFEEEKRRLMQDRGMTAEEAEARLRSQPSLQAKLDRADVVIDNGGSIEDTRVQVLRAFVAIDLTAARDKTPLLLKWLRITPPAVPAPKPDAVPGVHAPVPPAPITPSGEWIVRRAKPTDARTLAELLSHIEGSAAVLNRSETLERLGKYGYWFVLAGERILALAAWQAENLAAIVHELWVQDPEDAPRAIPMLLDAIETEANALQCEVVVLLLPERAAPLAQIAAQSAGYALTSLDDLHRLWRNVVEPLRQNGEPLYTKRLRDMVTRPI